MFYHATSIQNNIQIQVEKGVQKNIYKYKKKKEKLPVLSHIVCDCYENIFISLIV